MKLHNKIFILLFFTQFVSILAQKSTMRYNFNWIDYNFQEKDIRNITFKGGKKILLAAKSMKNSDSIYIYVKNNSKKVIDFYPQLRYLEIIQEAKDRKGKWKPIEYYKYDGHGWAEAVINLQPTKIIKTVCKKYSGNFNTKVRFKLLIDSKNYYSNSIDSFIDENQFNLPNIDQSKYPIYSLYSRCDKNLANKIIFLTAGAIEDHNKKCFK